ncbi:GON-4-like protein [Megalops cyprinoides]|uniref:GON-4-like protein n=1 Tax=Megalops cyprinoides TaxID=118141 RepID=UPI0018644F81|nr:GON-4-like protein [Megalops cyprinoides]
MSQTRKRRSASPDASLPLSRARNEEESECGSPASQDARCNTEKSEMATPTKEWGQGIVLDVPSPRRRSPRLKCPSQSPSQSPLPAGKPGTAMCPDLAQSGEEPQECLSPSHRPLLTEEDTDTSLVITLEDDQRGRRRGGRRKGGVKRKRSTTSGDGGAATEPGEGQEGMSREESQIEVEIDRQLDRELESKSRQHNLTTVNVRNIIHEVITNEHVVAMMKAAISETEAMPVFEPKMTRSKLKEVVEKGVVIPTWNISPMKKPNELKPPQFVDIPLEDEDSSDEEYRPDDDEEDETAEETFLESDIESTASSPRGSRGGMARTVLEGDEERSSSPTQGSHKSRHLTVEVVPMGPPPPPQPAGPPQPPRSPPECSFMEKLHAVEEELAISPICLEPYQALSGGGAGEEDGLMACRTRSKRPLRDVPLGRLEAELRAPDITPDMYDYASAPEDREWTQWLQGLMTSDMENEEEGDDDDDPEYNFLEDIDEPDLEDYRNDRAVRITKKEVSELMEEIFETFQDELGVQEPDDEGHEEEEEREEEAPPQETPNFNIPQTIRFEEPLANMLTERHRTVKEQLAALRRRRALLESQGGGPQNASVPQVLFMPQPCTLILTHLQRQQLQQQIQQHVQLLTQVHMLSSPVEALQSEAATTQLFLSELQSFAQRGEQARGAMEPGFVSIFRACNLQGALSLLEELKLSPPPNATAPSKPARSACVRSFPLLPPQLAWLLATRPVFMYPELLPHCSLDPALHPPRTNTVYTRGEDCLVVLGLRNFSETECPYQLVCQYLIRAKGHKQLRRHVHDMCHRRAPDNVIKSYVRQKMVPPMPLACGKVMPGEQRPPVEREKTVLPLWLRKSVPYIHEAVLEYNRSPEEASPQTATTTPPYIFPPGTRYPPKLPGTLTLQPSGFRRLRPPPVSRDSGTALSINPSLYSGQVSDLSSTAKSTLCGQGGGTACARQPTQGCTEKCNQWVSSRKLLPIQPAPPKPPAPPLQLLTISAGGGVNVLNLEGGAEVATALSSASGGDKLGTFAGGVSQRVPPAVIINMTAPLAATVICPAPAGDRLAASPLQTVPPLPGSATHPYPTLAHLRKLGRPLLPAPPRRDPPQSNPTLPVNTTSDGTPQFLIVPQNCLIANGAPSSVTAAETRHLPVNHSGAADQCSALTLARAPPMSAETDTSSPRITEPEGLSQTKEAGQRATESPAGTERDSSMKGVEGGQGEEQQKQQRGADEDEEVGNFGGPALALSESSGGPASGPDSRADTPESVADAQEEEEEGGEEGWSGLLASTPRHSPQARAEPQGEGGGGRERGRDGARQGGGEWEGPDEEEVMSPASEESVLSVPELQETMEKLSRLASEGRECGEEEMGACSSSSPASSTSPTSPASQNSQGEEEEDRGPGCQSPPSLRCNDHQEQESRDAAKLSPLYNDHVLDNDPLRESKDAAFAQAYLSRVCVAVQDVPGKVEEFLGVLYEFERGGEGRSSVELFSQLRAVLRDWPDLLRDFAAFLQPEQALECGLLAEQQAFERSRRFLRQLEVSFGENPSHYNKIVQALQEGLGVGPAGMNKMKAQMASLLKGHTHLQGEMWVFLDELQRPSSGPIQSEENTHPGAGEDATEGKDPSRGAKGRFRKVRLPGEEEEEKSCKTRPMKVRSRRKRDFGILNNNNKECNSVGKVRPSRGMIREARPRRLARKKSTSCSTYESSESNGRKNRSVSLPKSSTLPPAVHRGRRPEETEGKREEENSKANSPHPGKSRVHLKAGPEGGALLHSEEREEEDKGEEEGTEQEQEGRMGGGEGLCEETSPSLLTHPTVRSDHPFCAKNTSLTPTGERVVLWTREADRAILTACKLQGASQSTFQTVSAQLGNKTANEVSLRFRELMCLFHTATRQDNSEDEASDIELRSASDEEPD